MKKFLPLFLAASLCLGMTGCGSMGGKTEELSDEEVVVAFMDAFEAGDYEGITPYISEDNPLHQLFQSMDEETGGEMAEAFKTLFSHLKPASFSAKAVEGKEAWGTVSVELSMPDYSGALHDAMLAALTDQVENGSDAFHHMPDWVMAAAQGDGEVYEESFELHVGNRDGNMVMDTNTNRQFFAMLCGGLQPYLKATITTCTFPGGDSSCEILSLGDEIVAMISAETIPMDGEYTEEELEATIQGFAESMNAVDGIIACANIQDDGIAARIGVDIENASTYALSNLGLISDRITAGSNGWISLDSTISGFTRQGAECVTENFKNQE